MKTLRVHLSQSSMNKAQVFKESLQDSWLALFNSNITTSDILRALLMLGLELLNDSGINAINKDHSFMINAPLRSEERRVGKECRSTQESMQ